MNNRAGRDQVSIRGVRAHVGVGAFPLAIKRSRRRRSRTESCIGVGVFQLFNATIRPRCIAGGLREAEGRILE